jgi:hypothetical protein
VLRATEARVAFHNRVLGGIRKFRETSFDGRQDGEDHAEQLFITSVPVHHLHRNRSLP